MGEKSTYDRRSYEASSRFTGSVVETEENPFFIVGNVVWSI